MEDLVKKVSQYQLFNFLLSGALFVFLLSKTTPISLTSEDVVLALFTYYFIGLFISRIGSLLIEPLLKKFKVVVFAPYSDYVDAAKKDPKIDPLSQENNTYRTLISTFTIFLATLAVYNYAGDFISAHLNIFYYALAVALLILFVFSYRKQTKFIVERVKKANENG